MPSGHDSRQVKILASSLWCFTPRLKWARGDREKISKGKELTHCNQGKISRPRPPPEENRAKRRTKKRGSSLASQPGSNERMLCRSMHTLKKKEPGGARHATHSSVGDGLWEGWPVPPFGTAKNHNFTVSHFFSQVRGSSRGPPGLPVNMGQVRLYTSSELP